MSGGFFNYQHYLLKIILEQIESEIEKSGRLKTEKELKEESLYMDSSWYEKYPKDLYWYKYPDEVISKFKEAVYYLKKAFIYAQQLDYLLSGDSGNESFLKYLEEELNKLENEKLL